MFGVEIEFLTGRYVATAHFDRSTHEWPPHPARFYSALVATWADDDEPDLAERTVLEWLETLPPPYITASEAAIRTPVTHYVPVNDPAVIGTSWYTDRAQAVAHLVDEIDAAVESSEGKVDKLVERLQAKLSQARDVSDQVQRIGNTSPNAATDMLPDGRGKQPRLFPSVTPADPTVTFSWRMTLDDETKSTFDRLLSRVTRIGHSSSLVSCRLVLDPAPPTWVPGQGNHAVRWVRRGQLATLEREYAKHGASRRRVLPATSVDYGPVDPVPSIETPASNMTGEWIVFALDAESRRFPSTATVALTKTLRKAIISHGDDPLPEDITGHREDGSPSQLPHLSFLGLPYVEYEHADGRLMGLALMIPRSATGSTRTALFRAIGTWERDRGELELQLGRSGVARLERIVGKPAATTLDRNRWDGPSEIWTSATPLALPTHPGSLSQGGPKARARAWTKAEQAVAASCVHVGLPEPTDVQVSFTPFLRGARPAPGYPPFRQTGRDGSPMPRPLIHAIVTFAQAVGGPMLLGAGRYLGLGLMRPIRPSEQADD